MCRKFVEQGDHRAVAAVVRYLRKHGYGTEGETMLKIVAYRSDPRNLGDLLDLFSLPLTGLPGSRAREGAPTVTLAAERWVTSEHLPRILERIGSIHEKAAIRLLDHVKKTATPAQIPLHRRGAR